jgi:hypothetical protein
MNYQQLPLCSFAPVSWYVLYHQADCCLAEENFVKQSYRNRFDISTANGIQTLTIPVVSTGGIRTAFKEVKISPEFNGQKMMQAIRSAYGKAAYYEFVVDDLERVFTKETHFLQDFNLATFEWAKKYTGTELRWTSHLDEKYYDQAWKKRMERPVSLTPYLQVFSDRKPFEADLSILDVIMNQGKVSLSSLGTVNNS